MFASVANRACVPLQRVNKLVSVRPLSSRYVAELGDVVVGRVTDVAGKRWKVDVAAQQAAILMLSAVNLPGGIQVRRQSCTLGDTHAP